VDEARKSELSVGIESHRQIETVEIKIYVKTYVPVILCGEHGKKIMEL
jgi:hypothetical protein